MKSRKMKIRVLGCSGAEFPGRNSPSFLLDDELLFDAGSLTNVLDEKAQLKIKTIFITHAHLDHIRGIPFLADNVVVGNRGHRVSLISITPVIKTIRQHLFNSAVWPDFTLIPHPDDAILHLLTIKPGAPLFINGYTISAYRVNHTVPAVGYLVENTEGRRFFYTGDTGPTPKTWLSLRSTQIHCLIIDVSFPNRMEELAVLSGHLTPRLLRKELSMLRHAPEQIFVTHPKPQYVKDIRAELKSLKMRNLFLLSDGDRIIV